MPQVVTDQVEVFLSKQWTLFSKAEYWEKESVLRYCRCHQTGWEYYESFNGYAAAATFWYLGQGFSSPSPKRVMHEIRRHLKQSHGG